MDDGTAPVGALLVTSTERTPSAVLTARSFAEHHPGVALQVVVVDDRFGEVARLTTGEPGRWTPASRWIGSEGVAELMAEHPATDVVLTLQPRLIAAMLANLPSSTAGAAPDARLTPPWNGVLLLADDLEIYTPLTHFMDLAAAGSGGFVALRSQPVPVDGRLPDASDLAAYGHLQRGLALFTRRGLALVDRWVDGMHHHPLEGHGRFSRVAHSWFDELVLSPDGLLASNSSVHIARPELVRSFRNFDEESNESTSPGPAVISFEGFSPARPWALSDLAGEWPRVLISAHPMLQPMLDARVTHLIDLASVSAHIVRPYDTLPNGHRYDDAMRLAFTESLHHALRHGGEAPPNPFTDADAFVAFLAAPSTHRPGLSRHLEAMSRHRPDLGSAFAHDDGAFRKWASTDAVAAGIWTPISRPTRFLEEPQRLAGVIALPTPPERYAPGINVVGLLSAQLGIGEQGRLALQAIKASAIPYSVIDHNDTVHRREPMVIAGEPADGFRYDVDVLLLNADQTRSTLTSLHRHGRSERPTVGLWAWESPVFPERFHDAYQLVSEVWVATAYIKNTLLPSATAAGVPVEVLPLRFPYVNPRGTFQDIAFLAGIGLDPGRPYFAFMFDYFSVAERKQPWAAVQAYRSAFRQEVAGGPQLVIKSLNHEFFPLERERLLRSIGRRTDIVLVEHYLSPEHRTALVASAAGYVSLHRAEGLGLTLAEAMGAGTPVVATGWSGNMEFMTPENSWLVDAELVDIPKTVPHYGGSGQWAEPSVHQAAAHLRSIIEDPVATQRRAQQAIHDLNERNASGADASFIVERVRKLRASHGITTGSTYGSTHGRTHGRTHAYGAHTLNVPGGTT